MGAAEMSDYLVSLYDAAPTTVGRLAVLAMARQLEPLYGRRWLESVESRLKGITRWICRN